jgi:hypothetical protein
MTIGYAGGHDLFRENNGSALGRAGLCASILKRFVM